MNMTFSEELQKLEKDISNKSLYENKKESIFASFRRSCLELNKSVEKDKILKNTPVSSQAAGIFLLLDLSKGKLRRKHVLECSNVVIPYWRNILEREDLAKKLAELPAEFQLDFLGQGVVAPQVVSVPKEDGNSWDEIKRPKKKSESPKAVDDKKLNSFNDQTPDKKEIQTATRKLKPNNPFAPLIVNVEEPEIIPINEKWWQDTKTGTIDYQQLYLIQKTREIKQMQERILKQQQTLIGNTYPNL